MIFAKRLEILMQENGITRYRLSKLLDCSATTVTNWLSGKEATQTYIQKLSEIFGVTTDYLLGKSEQKEKTGTSSQGDIRLDELDHVYFSIAKEAQDSGIDPEDIRAVLDILKRHKK